MSFREKWKAGIRNFMAGRYGTDKLTACLLGAGVLVSLVSIFAPFQILRLALTLLSYGFMIVALFRTFSRNVYKRYRENQRFLLLLDRLKDRQHRYFTCPKCRQPVRVPRGKGKISITCPKCRERFVKKT